MLQITLKLARKNRVTVQLFRDGAPFDSFTVTQADGKGWRNVAAKAGCDAQWLLGQALSLTEEQGTVTHDIQQAADRGTDGIRFLVRGMAQPHESGKTCGDFTSAIGMATPGDIIEWKGERQRLCCLDIDYHGTTPPDAAWSLATVERLQPRPKWYWISKGGGVHCIFEASGYLAADELAVVAGLMWLHFDRTATIELLDHTSAPPGELYTTTAGCDLSYVAKLFGRSVDEDVVAQWLEDNDYVQGASYPHDRCPLAPKEESHGSPVYVQDLGITCLHCKARGQCLGSRSPGFFPYTALCGDVPFSLLRSMVGRLTHWDHARVVLEAKLGLTGEVARLAWKAMLHLVHGDDRRVQRAMTAGRNLIRMDCKWGNLEGRLYDRNIRNMVAALPACQDDTGAPIGETVDRFLQAIDLTEEGYPSIYAIPGISLANRYGCTIDDRITTVIPLDDLANPRLASRRPRYVPERHRDMETAWGLVDEVYPGIDHNYLLLLLAAKGVVETRMGLPPNIIVSGYTSSGKTSTIQLAAAITGDKCSEIAWTQSVDRFKQAFWDGSQAGSYVAINELLKDAARLGSTPVQAMDVFLNVTPHALNHKLYHGTIPLGRNPVTVVTDIQVPQELRNDQQLSRRFIYVHLLDAINWTDSLKATQVHLPWRFRLADEKYCEAANALVSYVIDRWFKEPHTLVDIARELGYDTLSEAKNFEDPRSHLKRFYELWTKYSESTDRRWSGGWKVIRRGEETELATMWDYLCDGDSAAQWKESRQIDSQDWTKLLERERRIHCEHRAHGSTLGIRFVEAPA